MPRARANVDKVWFFRRMEERGISLRKAARLMEMEPSALSRALKGERAMKAPEVRKLAETLGRPEAEVLVHLTMPNGKPEDSDRGSEIQLERIPGLMEGQARFTGERDMNDEKEDYIVPPAGADPLFGCMAGTLTLLPDVDYTAPADPDWGKAYDD